MKPFIITTVHCVNPVGFAHVRLLIESVLQRVPREDYETLIIVDDHSPYRDEGYFAWGAWLEREHGVVFHSLGEGRTSGLGPKGAPDTPGLKSSGPGGALTAGAAEVARRGGRWMWTLDSDCFVLDGSCLSAAMAHTVHTDVAAIGEYRGGHFGAVMDATDLTGQTCTWPDGRVERVPRAKGTERGRHGADTGRVVAMCGIFDIERLGRRFSADFQPYGGPPYVNLSTDFGNYGQPGALFNVGAWALGERTVYHPFFRGESVVHFGCASVGFTRKQFGAGIEYGNSVHRRVYGAKGSKDYYAGYLQLNARLADFQPHLEKLYADRPFDSFAVDEFDRSLLVRPT